MEVGEVTSRGRMRILEEEEEEGSFVSVESEAEAEASCRRDCSRWGQEEGFRAVATRRWVGCEAMSWARARPRPEEQPVMKKTASGTRA